MYGFSKYDAQDRYDSYNTVQVKLKLNMKTDADILAWPMGHKVNPSAFYIRWLSAALTGIP